MATLSVYSISQPALVVDGLEVAVDRMHDLFGAVPSERLLGRNAVYAFENETFLELLGPVDEGHTRWRFLRRFGPGYYMFCADLENTDPGEVEAELARLGKRIVDGGRDRYEGNVRAGYHIHPHDAGGMIMLLTIKDDRRENGLWAGFSYRAYIPGNTRYVREVRGVLARTADPAAEAPGFGELGMVMAPLGAAGTWRWQGPTGTLLELWPAGSWSGSPVDERRDYALCLRARDVPALLARLSRYGHIAQRLPADGRWLTNVDPILGVRLAVEPSPGP
jgi:hypothetical protein